ncbi:MAG: lysostaphin resistance A-like protein [Candidatus Kapaibacteriota bacterium]|jgi:membrane protease YdiL (CAAX protease family)
MDQDKSNLEPRWQTSWWLSFIFFNLVFLPLLILPFFFLEPTLTEYSTFLFIASFSANLVVIFSFNYRKWHCFGLVLHRDSLKNFLFGLLLPLIFFIPLLGILSFWGIRFISVSFKEILHSFYFTSLAAASEEMIFRGVLFQRLIDKRGEVFAILTNSLFFSLVHLFNPNISIISLVNIFLAGVVLSLSYIKTSMLWLPIGYHIGWNFWQRFLLGSPMSGTTWGSSAVQTKITEIFPLLFGGNFGIEGGLITTAFLLLTAIIISKKFVPVPEVISRILLEKYSNKPIQLHSRDIEQSQL